MPTTLPRSPPVPGGMSGDLPPSSRCLANGGCCAGPWSGPTDAAPPRPPRVLFANRSCAWPAASGGRRYRCSSAWRIPMCKIHIFLCIRQSASRSAATDLAGRPRARDEASRRGRLPRLLRLVLWCSRGRRRGRLRRFNSRFCCDFGPCGSRLPVVLLETAMLVFAARAAMTGLVAPRSCRGRSSHKKECTVPT